MNESSNFNGLKIHFRHKDTNHFFILNTLYYCELIFFRIYRNGNDLIIKWKQKQLIVIFYASPIFGIFHEIGKQQRNSNPFCLNYLPHPFQ